MDILWIIYLLLDWIARVWREILDFVLHLDLFGFISMFWCTLFLDVPRYGITSIIALLVHIWQERYKAQEQKRLWEEKILANPPLVSVIMTAYNEEKVIPFTLRSLLEQTYPNLEILIIDDGSTDRTYEICQPLAKQGLIRLFRLDGRSGKHAAANLGARFSKGEYIVVVDSDSTFDRNAILNLIRYFCDPKVGAVAGNLRVLNRTESLATRFQALEYLLAISLGRRFNSLVNILYIVSGAFGAFRREIFEAIKGHDGVPGEDTDLTIKTRKSGFKIAFAPDAICFTEVPNTFGKLVSQRLRWDRAFVKLRLRKHRDILNPTWKSFTLSNFIGYIDCLFFAFLLPFSFLFYMLYIILFYPNHLLTIMILTKIGYTFLTAFQLGIAVCLSERPWEDLQLLPYTLFYSFYQIGFLRPVRMIAFLGEIFFRYSYKDSYTPSRVAKEYIKW